MNVKKVIHEELGKDLEEIGFVYVQEGRGVWQYRRQKNDVQQEIVIIADRYERRNLKVMFCTSAYGQREYKEFSDFIEEESVRVRKTRSDYRGYENIEQLRAVIQEFKRLIFVYGLDFLEEISKPSTDAIPTEELYKYLYENHQRLYEEYREKLHTKDKTPEEVIEIIYKKMDETLDIPFDEAKEFLCGLAALYGHTICWGDKGEWVWDSEEKNCYIKKILQTKKDKDVLGLLIAIWDCLRKHKGTKSSTLFKHYKTILIYYYRDHPEEKNKK